MVDVAVIGAGPIGIEMASVLKRAGVNYLHFESGPLGNTITRWPRNTHFFSSPEWISICGIPIQTAGQEIVTGEHYLAYLRLVVETLDLDVNTYETVTGISGAPGAFTIESKNLAGQDRRHTARFVILATGDMNHARKLSVPGEQLPHVTHYWIDPHLYFQRELLIVGGANSAVEAALRCWRAGVCVSISYRGSHLDEKRLISRLHLELDLLIRNRQIAFYPLTEVVEIQPGVTVLRGTAGMQDAAGDESDALRSRAAEAHGGAAVLTEPGTTREVNADFVYLATGFEMDQSLYEMVGIETVDIEKKPVHDTETMESSTPGVFVVGTSIGGNQRGYKVFITTSHVHCLRAGREITRRLSADDPSRSFRSIERDWVGNLATRDYPLSSGDVE